LSVSKFTDRDEIRQLVATYTAAGDQRRNDLRAHIWAEDAVMVLPVWRAEGRLGILKALGAGAAQAAAAIAEGRPEPMIRHHITSSLVTFDGPDEATGRSYWINFSEKGPDHSGLYADRYRRIDGAWKIVFREVRIDWKAADSRLGAEMRVGPRPPELGPVPVITAD